MQGYRFLEHPDGFTIEPPRGDAVTVDLQPWRFLVRSRERADGRVGLCQGSRLVAHVGVLVVRDRLVPYEGDASTPYRRILNRSMALATAKALRPEIDRQRRRLLAKVDPTVLAVQRAVLGNGGEYPEMVLGDEALYRDRYLVHDILTYPAAAIAVAYVWEWLDFRCAIAGRKDAGPEEAAGLVQMLSQWRGLFSPTGTPYRSLDRTLMNLPPRIPGYALCSLRHTVLERPMLNRLELMSLLSRLMYVSNREHLEPEWPTTLSQIRMLQHTREAEVRAAVARFTASTGWVCDPDSDRDLGNFIEFVCDYPQPHAGRLGGLLTKALRRWRQRRQQRAEDFSFDHFSLEEPGGPDTPTALPSIPLPQVEGITFLATVGAVIREGNRLQNCLLDCVDRAFEGSSFLFHIEHRGEQACVEVSPWGEIREAAGPRNADNGAARWGALRLRRWAAGLRAPNYPVLERPGDRVPEEGA